MMSFFLILIMAGLLLSLAASPAAAAKLNISNPFYFFSRHLAFAILGVGGAIFVSLFSPVNARRLGVLALICAIIAMFLILFIGTEVKGATRWLRFGGLSLQPSEFAKPGFIVFAAWMFSHRKKDLSFPGIGFVFAVYALLIALLIRQPDFGQSFLLTLCFGAIFFFAGISAGWMLFLVAVSSIGAAGAYFALPHVQDRIARFLSPEGSDTYQTDKALEAMANGG
ncbi:MAG: FtsW/RodA/SpoVE family cell cycle protein, partial [Robiginitomaculum sp.]